jgi:DNA-binding MarR family transcriptional regulator
LKLITRSEDPSDRRIRQIILTDKGREILKESTRVHQAWVEALVGALTTAEAEQVRAALGILIDKAHQLDNKPA